MAGARSKLQSGYCARCRSANEVAGLKSEVPRRVLLRMPH